MSTLSSVGGEAFKPAIQQSITAGEQKITHSKSINSGRQIERLQLSEGDPVFNLAVKKLGGEGKKATGLFHRFRYVTVKTKDGQEFDLNIRSAAKRLGISKAEVKELAKSDDAVQALQNKMSIRKAALEKYEGLAQQYAQHKGKLVQGKVETGLKPSTLLKAIQQGFTIEDSNVVFKAQKLEVGKHRFYATADLKTLHFVQKPLGAGAYGTVFKAVELNQAKFHAVKESSTKEGAKEDLKNERDALLELNPHGTAPGIQSPPSEITYISTKGIETGFYHTEQMSGDLIGDGFFMQGFQGLPAGKRLDLCKQLLDGLENLQEKGYLHGDIKPGNCLMKEGADGTPEKLVISDFGGARKDGEKPTSYSDDYRPADYREDRAKADVFAMSKTLIEVLGGSHFRFPDPPGPLAKNDPLLKELRDHLTMCGIPDSVSNVLISGLYKASDRPTAKELNDAYKDAVGSLTQEQQGAINRFHLLYAAF